MFVKKVMALIGKNIKMMRERMGISQDQLAKMTGITIKSLSRIENGHAQPRANNIDIIAEALNCEPIEFLVKHKKQMNDEKLSELVELYSRMDTIAQDDLLTFARRFALSRSNR